MWKNLTQKYLHTGNYHVFYSHMKKDFLYMCSDKAIESLAKKAILTTKGFSLYKTKKTRPIVCMMDEKNKFDIDVNVLVNKNYDVHDVIELIEAQIFNYIKDILDTKPRSINVIIHGYEK